MLWAIAENLMDTSLAWASQALGPWVCFWVQLLTFEDQSGQNKSKDKATPLQRLSQVRIAGVSLTGSPSWECL